MPSIAQSDLQATTEVLSFIQLLPQLSVGLQGFVELLVELFFDLFSLDELLLQLVLLSHGVLSLLLSLDWLKLILLSLQVFENDAQNPNLLPEVAASLALANRFILKNLKTQ